MSEINDILEAWLINRETKGNFTALRELEKSYPQHAAALSQFVFDFLEVEDYEEVELTPEEKERLSERTKANFEKFWKQKELEKEPDTLCYKCEHEFHHSQAKYILQSDGVASEIDVCPKCESDDLHDLYIQNEAEQAIDETRFNDSVYEI